MSRPSPDGSPDAQVLVEAVAGHVDRVSERCRDRWHDTPLLVDGFDPGTGEPARWEGHVLSNFACQQNVLRALDGLEALTGEARYRRRADAWTAFALERLHEPASDLLYWGGHASWDLEAGQPLVGNHEMKCVYPHYAALFRVAPERLRAFVAAFWHAHVHDWPTLLFNRHGEYREWDRARRWQMAPFAGGPLPIVENTLLSFVNTGSDLIFAGALLGALAGDEEPLRWARHLLGRYEQVRDAETGLAGYQFNHREPCRVRASFRPPYGERPDVNEVTVVNGNVIRTRYGRAALTFMQLYETLGPERGQDFLDVVLRDLAALTEYSYDWADGSFWSVLHDGTRLVPDDAMEGVGYCPPNKLAAVPACGLMLLSYARAYRLTGDEDLREVAWGQATGMGWAKIQGGRLRVDWDGCQRFSPSSEAWANAGQDDVCALLGLLELHRADGDADLLGAAADLGGRLLARTCVDGLLSGGIDGRHGHTSIDSALPLGLLHLAAALEGRDVALPAFYPNLSYFDPKVVVARRKR